MYIFVDISQPQPVRTRIQSPWLNKDEIRQYTGCGKILNYVNWEFEDGVLKFLLLFSSHTNLTPCKPIYIFKFAIFSLYRYRRTNAPLIYFISLFYYFYVPFVSA